MKLVWYGLALVLVTGFGVVMPLSNAQVALHGRTSSTQRLVFVDRTKLTEMHPAWDALREMKSTLAEVRGASALAAVGRASRGVSSRGGFNALAGGRSNGVQVSRQALEVEAARSAVRAFQQSKSDMQEALGVRLNSMRTVMTESAAASRAAQTLEIQDEAEAKADSVDKRYGPSRLNAQLRVGALGAASKSVGVDPDEGQLRLRTAQAGLGTVASTSTARRDQVLAAAQARVDALKQADAVKITGKLGEYETRENLRISKSVAEAQDQILSELSEFNVRVSDKPAERARLVSSGGAGGRVSHGASLGGGQSLRGLEAAVRTLESRINADVDHAVRSTASRSGLRVTFSAGGRTEDATREFVDMMRKYSWRAYSPVLSGTRGS